MRAAYTQVDKPRFNAAPSPEQFFRTLAQYSNSAPMPSHDEVLRAVDQIPGLGASEARTAVVQVMAALANSNDQVKKYAALALTVVGDRQDGQELLGPHVNRIAGLLNEGNDRLQVGGVYILAMLERSRSSEIIPLLVKFIRRPDRDLHAEASALGLLARHARENNEAAAAVKEFLSRPLTADVRIDALNSLRNSQTTDYQIIDSVIAALDDPDKGVRFTAVQVIPAMGPDALSQAEPALRKTLERADESTETKELAKKALEKVGTLKK